MRRKAWWITAAAWSAAAWGGITQGAMTNNIMVVGYWPPSNEMLRPFSTNPAQNPLGWQGQNWEGRGYNIHAFFPEFPGGIGQNPRGEGDFEVDYQDTSEDFWRITEEIKPVAIVTFSRGSAGANWELEYRFRNRKQWIDDYLVPSQPTPSQPEMERDAEALRYSTLPMAAIRSAVNGAGLGLNAFVDLSSPQLAGGFLSEFLGYHGVWYQSLHSLATDPAQVLAAGHIHVGTWTSPWQAAEATKVTLRTLIDNLGPAVAVPSPGVSAIALAGLGLMRRRRRGGLASRG
ncbi:MAG: hypothetical protein ACKVW3_14750 [Phycisphaerales bacterium]